MQFVVNTVFLASVALLAALAFQPILVTNRAFILSAAIAYPVGAYAYWTAIKGGGSEMVATFAGIASAGITSAGLDLALIRRFRLAAFPSWGMLVATLGLFVVGQNILSLVFGDDPLPLRRGKTTAGIAILGAHVTQIQLFGTVATFVVAGVFWLLFVRTDVGRSIRAVSSNPELAIIFGHDAERTRLYAALIGGFVAGVTGIIAGLDTGVTPMLGFRLLLNGIVVILIAGLTGVLPMLVAAVFVAILQNLAATFLGIAWMDSVAFLILVGFLIWKPTGLAGQRLRKVEI